MLVRIFLFVFMLLSSTAVGAARGPLLYVPLDNRPVCLDYALETMTAAGWEVETPPRDVIAGADRGGDPEKIFAWLQARLPKASAVVASADALLYGGLVDSRTHHLPEEILRARAQRLVELKRQYSGKTVYIFTTVMRSPKMSAAPVEPPYYGVWGPQLFRLGALEDMLEDGCISMRGVRELAALRAHIPAEVLDDMYLRRRHNLRATMELLRSMQSGAFDYLLIGRDDTAPYSQAHREARVLQKMVQEISPERVRFFAGADQLGLLLLTRAALRLQYELPLVHIAYAPGEGGNTTPAYEDDTLAVSARQHIYAAGAFPAAQSARADLLLAVNTPRDGRTADAAAPANLARPTAEVRAFTKMVGQSLQQGLPVAVADVKYGNGADNALVAELFAQKLAWDVAAYNGWNTAGNALGYALAQGLLCGAYDGAAHKQLLEARYLDDWAYQANARLQVYKELIWPQYWPGSGLNAAQKAAAEQAISLKITALAEPFLGTAVREYVFTLPWNRMFEVYAERK